MIEELIHSCGQLRVSSAAAETFSRNGERLASLVSAQLEADPRIPTLIGATTSASLRDSHNNRAKLLKFVLQVNAWEVLVRSACWEYRTQQARGVSYQYFLAEFAAWKRAALQVERSCSQEICAVFAWLMEHHEKVIELAQAGAGLDVSNGHDLSPGPEAFLSLLLQGDSDAALALAQRSVATRSEFRTFYADTVCPAMHRVGLLWERNEISVAEEHLCTALVGRIMTALYLRFAQPGRRTDRVALVAAGPNELHEVGARMVADYLELEGWRVTYLGGNLSATELLAGVRRLSPALLSLSVSTVYNLESTRQLVQTLKADQKARKVRVMLGGYVFNCLPGLWRHFQADDCQRDPEGAVRSANSWWERREL